MIAILNIVYSQLKEIGKVYETRLTYPQLLFCVLKRIYKVLS